MGNDTLWDALSDFVNPLGVFALVYMDGKWQVGPIIVFFAVGVFFYMRTATTIRTASLGGMVRYLFPLEFYKAKTTRMDVLNFILSHTFIFKGLAVVAALPLGAELYDWTVAAAGPSPLLIQNTFAAVAIQVTTIFLMEEFAGYAMHRAAHRFPALWQFHAVHHSTDVLTPFAVIRQHPVDLLCMVAASVSANALATALVLYISGPSLNPASLAVLALLFSAQPFLALLNHSHFKVSFGPLSRVLMSPHMHQVHHSAEIRHRDRNFGGRLSLWDWLLGTICIPEPREEFCLGLDVDQRGTNNPHLTVKQFYIDPMIASFRILRSGPR